MADDKKKILQAAKKNLDALGNALGKKIGVTIENQDAASAGVNTNLSAVKKSFTKPVGTLTTIPDEVYKKIAETLNANAKINSIFTKYSTNEGKCIKQVATQIGKLLSKINDVKVPVEENGKTVTYTVKFEGSHLGVSGSFINVLQGKKNSWINWKNESTGKTAMAQYCVSLYNLGKNVTDAKGIILDTLIENGAKLLSAVFNDGTDSVYKKVFGNAAFKIVSKEYKTSKLEKLITGVNNKKISEAVTLYKTLNNLYNNLSSEINSAKGTVENIKIWGNSFASNAKTLQSKLKSLGVTVDLETLPILALDLVYNKKSTEVTLLANCTSEVKTSDYKSSVKIIYADTFTKAVTINGNDKDNKIYSGKGKDVLKGGNGNDTLSGGAGNDKLYGDSGKDSLNGGAGNDSLWGGAGDDILTGGSGKDVFFYANSDGNDVIADFSSNDMIKLTKGSIKKVTKSGNDVTFKIGSGSIKVQNAKGKEITIVDANNFEKKYLNGKLVSSVPADALKYNGHSYKIYSGIADTWEEAKVYCESLGGHLAVINDENENTVLFNYMNSKGYMEAYFGLSDSAKEGTWTWVTSESVNYINWGGSEPNGYTYENYGMFYAWAYPNGEWNDGDFTGAKEFICEWDNVGSISTNNANNLLNNVTFAQSNSKK